MYVPVMVAEHFQVQCRIIFDRFLTEDEQTGSNWFLLIFQIAKPSTKKDDYVVASKICWCNVFFLTDDLTEGQTEAAISVS